MPATARDYAVAESIADTPLAHLWGIVVMLTFGWPGYLAANFSGPAKYKGASNSHFSPSSALFEPKQAALIVRSNIGLIVALSALAWAFNEFGARK